jgi:parallel beta-helix repeat protein
LQGQDLLPFGAESTDCDGLFIDFTLADGEQHGLLILGGSSGRFAENEIRGNKGHGIVLGGGQEAELEQNELNDNRAPQVRRIAQ